MSKTFIGKRQIRTPQDLREVVSDVKREYPWVDVLVGIEAATVTEKEALAVLPGMVKKMKNSGMKNATATLPLPDSENKITLNVIFVKYLKDYNACKGFISRQAMHNMTKLLVTKA